MKEFSFKLKLYIHSIYIITIISIVVFAINGYMDISNIDYKGTVFFIILTALTETFIFQFRGLAVSTGFAITMACYIIFGPALSIIITIVGFSFRVVKINGKKVHILNTPIYKTLFNYCTFALLILYGNYFYVILGGKPISFEGQGIFRYAPQLFVYAFVYVVLNNIIISILTSCITGKKILSSFINNIRVVLFSNLMMSPFGVIIAYLYMTSIIGALMFLCPVMLAKFTFSIYIESKEKYIQTVNALTRSIEIRDKYTEGHSQRVADISESIAKVMKYSELKREHLKIAALMHDVGKIGIDDAILNKPGKLTNEEYEMIKRHPVMGYNILKDIKDLESILDLVKYHHERYDGKGYPEGKTADELNVSVFIIQLADSVDAMATDRPYRKAMSEEEIIQEIIRCTGTQFHPEVVKAYLKTKGIDASRILSEAKGEAACSSK